MDATRKKTKRRAQFKKGLEVMFFIGPHFLFFCIFVVYPFFFGIGASFTKWDMMSPPQFVGFENYASIFSPGSVYNREFLSGLGHTILFTIVMVPLLIAVPLLFAVILFNIRNTTIRSIFQAILYASSILSVATVVLIWRWLLDRENGAINNIFGIEINWAGSQPFAWISIFLLTLWSGVGGNMIIYLSALNSIPKSLYESCELETSSPIKKFFYITLPSLRFPLLFTIVSGTIAGFNVFGQPFMFGGPSESTTVLMQTIYYYAFGTSTPMAGMASAMSVLLGLVILVFSIIQFRVLKEDK